MSAGSWVASSIFSPWADRTPQGVSLFHAASGWAMRLQAGRAGYPCEGEFLRRAVTALSAPPCPGSSPPPSSICLCVHWCRLPAPMCAACYPEWSGLICSPTPIPRRLRGRGGQVKGYPLRGGRFSPRLHIRSRSRRRSPTGLSDAKERKKEGWDALRCSSGVALLASN